MSILLRVFTVLSFKFSHGFWHAQRFWRTHLSLNLSLHSCFCIAFVFVLLFSPLNCLVSSLPCTCSSAVACTDNSNSGSRWVQSIAAERDFGAPTSLITTTIILQITAILQFFAPELPHSYNQCGETWLINVLASPQQQTVILSYDLS
jgi:hypothetical protein